MQTALTGSYSHLVRAFPCYSRSTSIRKVVVRKKASRVGSGMCARRHVCTHAVAQCPGTTCLHCDMRVSVNLRSTRPLSLSTEEHGHSVPVCAVALARLHMRYGRSLGLRGGRALRRPWKHCGTFQRPKDKRESVWKPLCAIPMARCQNPRSLHFAPLGTCHATQLASRCTDPSNRKTSLLPLHSRHNPPLFEPFARRQR